MSIATAVVLTDCQLLRAIALAIRGSESSWASSERLSDILTAAPDVILAAVRRNTFAAQINGYVRAQMMSEVFAGPYPVVNAPTQMYALARALTSELRPLVPQRVLLNAGWLCFRIPAYRKQLWLPVLLEAEFLLIDRDFYLVSSTMDDAIVANRITSYFL